MQRVVVLSKQSKDLYYMNKDLQTSQSKEDCMQLSLQHNNKVVDAVRACFSLFELWHMRLGHLAFDQLKNIGISECSNSRFHAVCQIYPVVKMYRNSFPLSNIRATSYFELLHVDIWGPYPHSTYNGSQYFLTLVDDHFRATWVHLLGHKSNAFPLLKYFVLFLLRSNFRPLSRS